LIIDSRGLVLSSPATRPAARSPGDILPVDAVTAQAALDRRADPRRRGGLDGGDGRAAALVRVVARHGALARALQRAGSQVGARVAALAGNGHAALPLRPLQPGARGRRPFGSPAGLRALAAGARGGRPAPGRFRRADRRDRGPPRHPPRNGAGLPARPLLPRLRDGGGLRWRALPALCAGAAARARLDADGDRGGATRLDGRDPGSAHYSEVGVRRARRANVEDGARPLALGPAGPLWGSSSDGRPVSGRIPRTCRTGQARAMPTTNRRVDLHRAQRLKPARRTARLDDPPSDIRAQRETGPSRASGCAPSRRRARL
jgi:hypothetical protein